MKQFDYRGVDKNGRTVRGTTAAASREEVKTQLEDFGFSDIRVKEQAAPGGHGRSSEPAQQAQADDFVQRLVDGDIDVEAPTEEEEEADEWRRLEVLARVRKYKRRENVVLVMTLIVLGSLAAYFIYDKITEIPAPQPRIITSSSSGMLSLKDVYIKGQELVFVVYARNWNGNVRVDFKAWDPFDNEVDFGVARIGNVGDYFGGAAEKSGTFRLKKNRYYETIEIRVSGDEKP